MITPFWQDAYIRAHSFAALAPNWQTAPDNDIPCLS